jgi:phosphoenolpyruvate carboxylase
MLAGGDLAAATNQFEVFGLHTARLDLRQHSSWHEAAVAEVLGRPDYPGWARSEKRGSSWRRSSRPRRSSPRRSRASRARRATSSTRLSSRARPARRSARGLGIYIISMTNGVSDILEVELLQKLAGSSLPDRAALRDPGRPRARPRPCSPISSRSPAAAPPTST